MKLLLGVTASVACKLTPKLVAALLEAIPGLELKVIATEKSFHFFRREDVPASVPVLTDKDEWPEGGYVKGADIPHIDLGKWTDLLLIAPLSADTLSDMAHGKTSKFITSLVAAWPRKDKEIILAPAMNTNMWENPIIQENLEKVRGNYRTRVIGPVSGMLACKTEGMGAMDQIDVIVAAVIANLSHV